MARKNSFFFIIGFFLIQNNLFLVRMRHLSIGLFHLFILGPQLSRTGTAPDRWCFMVKLLNLQDNPLLRRGRCGTKPASAAAWVGRKGLRPDKRSPRDGGGPQPLSRNPSPGKRGVNRGHSVSQKVHLKAGISTRYRRSSRLSGEGRECQNG
jgi:hypothetical protein